MYSWKLDSNICLPKAVGYQDQLVSLNLPRRPGFPEYSNVETSPATEDLPQCRNTGPERIQPKLASTFLSPSSPNFSTFCLVVSIHLKNMFIKLDHFPRYLMEIILKKLKPPPIFFILDPRLLFHKRVVWVPQLPFLQESSLSRLPAMWLLKAKIPPWRNKSAGCPKTFFCYARKMSCSKIVGRSWYKM